MTNRLFALVLVFVPTSLGAMNNQLPRTNAECVCKGPVESPLAIPARTRLPALLQPSVGQGMPRGVPIGGCDDGTVIDLLAVYTADARIAAGGTAAIVARINAAVADTNTAFSNSLIDTSVYLVHTQEIVYAETGNSETDSLRLLDPTDGFLDEVPVLRDQYAADIAVLWVDALDTGGRVLAPMDILGEGGFHELRQAEGTLTTAHELGHNLGCVHDRPNAFPYNYFPYSYGYHNPGGAFHTVMAVVPPATPQAPYYSNPDVMFMGVPTGIPIGQPNESDVAATIQLTRHVVANYRNAPMAGLPTILHVDASVAPGGDGETWATALNDLQDALCLARRSGGDVEEIWVRAGSYKPDRGTGLRIMSFVLENDLGIYGGFAGGETMRSQRNPALNQTILSGDIGAINDQTDNTAHVVFAKGVDATAILDGFTITGGNADTDNYFFDDIGGGILIESASPTISNCVVTLNVATGNGGGIYIGNGHPTIVDSVISSNAGFNGAGIGVIDGSAPTITGCTFALNVAANVGGGLYNDQTNPVVTDSDFSNNAASYGGAVANFDNTAEFVLCDFDADNHAATAGGAVDNDMSDSTYTQCTFVGNNSPFGGAMHNFDSNPILTLCTFDGNTADTGGAVANRSGSAPAFDACEFLNNSADWSGAMDSFDGSPTVDGCTFVGNSAVNGGGAAIFSGPGHPIVTTTDFTDNHAGFGGAVYFLSTLDAEIDGGTFVINSANDGGAIYVFDATPTIRNATFDTNTAGDPVADSGVGGAIFNVSNSAPIISGSVFFNNEAGFAGGAIRNQDSPANIVNCLFFGNAADWSGGAVENINSDALITGCVFTGNVIDSSHGGAISNVADSNPMMTNLTIVNNSAGSSGGGIAVDATAPVLTNSILWGNTAGFGTTEEQQILHFSGATIVNHTTLQGWTGALGGVGNDTLDPLLTDPDGADDTTGTLDDDVTLSVGSPAIDAGANTAVPADAADVDGDSNIAERLPRDAAGNPRFGDDAATIDTGIADPPTYPNVVDRGAYELVDVGACQTCYADANGDGQIDGADVQSFANCILSGPAIAPGCGCADTNASDSVNLSDVLDFVSAVLVSGSCG